MKFTALNAGIVAGIATIVMTLLLYVIGPQIFTSLWTGIIIFIISIIIVLVLGFKGRSDNGGYFTYMDAFKFLVITSIIMSVASVLINYLLFQVVDTEYMEEVKKITIEAQAEMFEGFGMTDDQIEKSIGEIEKSFDDRKTIVGQLKTTGGSLLFWLVISAIGALVIKKNKPEFAE